MIFADTHTHLHFRDYQEDLGPVLARAREGGFRYFLTVGTTLACSREAVSLAERTEDVYAAIGCHPHDAQGFREEEYEHFKRLAAHPKVRAIGEIGLDFYRNLSPRDAQEKTLRSFLRLHRETLLPIILHVRDGHDETFRVLCEELEPPIRGVLHCFSGDEAVCEKVRELGLWVGYAGNLTYRKNGALRKTLALVPREKLLLETDCPFLSPEGLRGKRNEPAYLVEAARCMAETLGMSLEEISRLTTENASSLFRWHQKNGVGS